MLTPSPAFRYTSARFDPRAATVRPVYFGGWCETPIHQRQALEPGMVIDGPAIVEQPDTTIVIEPGMHARVDAYGNLLARFA